MTDNADSAGTKGAKYSKLLLLINVPLHVPGAVSIILLFTIHGLGDKFSAFTAFILPLAVIAVSIPTLVAWKSDRLFKKVPRFKTFGYIMAVLAVCTLPLLIAPLAIPTILKPAGLIACPEGTSLEIGLSKTLYAYKPINPTTEIKIQPSCQGQAQTTKLDQDMVLSQFLVVFLFINALYIFLQVMMRNIKGAARIILDAGTAAIYIAVFVVPTIP